MRITIDVTEASAVTTEVSGERSAQVMAPGQDVGTQPPSRVEFNGGADAFSEAQETTAPAGRPATAGSAFDGGAAAFSEAQETTAPADRHMATGAAFGGGAAPEL